MRQFRLVNYTKTTCQESVLIYTKPFTSPPTLLLSQLRELAQMRDHVNGLRNLLPLPLVGALLSMLRMHYYSLCLADRAVAAGKLTYRLRSAAFQDYRL